MAMIDISPAIGSTGMRANRGDVVMVLAKNEAKAGVISMDIYRTLQFEVDWDISG